MRIARLVPLFCVPLLLAPAIGFAQLRRIPAVSPRYERPVRSVAYEEPLLAFAEDEFLPPEPDQPDDLKLANLEAMALANNPAIAEAEARIRAARGTWVQAGLYPNPTIAYSGTDVGAGGTAGKQGGFIGQRLVTGGKLRLSRAVACQEIERAEQVFAAQQLRVLTDVRTRYYEVLVSQRRGKLVAEIATISGQSVDAVEKLIKAGEASRVDLLQAQIEVESAQFLLENTQSEHRAAWRRLAAAVGMPDLKPRPLSGNIDEPGPAIRWEDALGRLLSESPEIAAARAEVDRAYWVVRRARAEVVPNLDFEVGVHSDNTIGETVTEIRVGIPLPIFNRNQGAICRAEAEWVAAQRKLRRMELGLHERLAEVYQRYAAASTRIDRYSKRILPTAQETLDLVTKGYQAGEFGYLRLLTAQRTNFRTNLAFVESLRQAWLARTEIEGLLLTGSLKAGP